MLGFVKLSQFQPQQNYFFHDRKATFTTTKKQDMNRPNVSRITKYSNIHQKSVACDALYSCTTSSVNSELAAYVMTEFNQHGVLFTNYSCNKYEITLKEFLQYTYCIYCIK